ncbi:MAG: acyl-CoA dehydrogenase family protein [Pseudomonadales bacterium]
MPAIAFDLPADVIAARDGGCWPLPTRNSAPPCAARELFDNPRRLYREDGRFSDELLALIREVRTTASAGFYPMCVPEELGGGGQALPTTLQEALFHHCGPRNWLMLYAVAHWAAGPSRLLEQMTPEARAQFLPGLMDGTRSMSFGLSGDPRPAPTPACSRTRAEPDGDGWRLTGTNLDWYPRR